MIASHVQALDRTGIDAECTEDAFAIIDLEPVDTESFAHRVLLFFNVDAIDRAGPNAFITGDTRSQIKSMEAPVAWSYCNGFLGVFELLGERVRTIRSQHCTHRHPHPREDGEDGLPDVVKPGAHGVGISRIVLSAES